MTSLKQILNYGTKNIEYDIIKSKRIKTSEIIVDENKILVRTPMNKSLEESRDLVKHKASWIIKKQLEYKNRQRSLEITSPTYTNNSTLPYLGKNIKLAVGSSPTSTKLELKDNQFCANLENNKGKNIDSRHQVKAAYEKWIKEQATKILEPKVLKYSRIIKVKPANIIFKNLKNRWGSATKERTLNLNFNILKAPEEVIDYIIIHELCHLKIKEHSRHYWNLVEKYSSDYKTKIEWLETNGKYLIM